VPSAKPAISRAATAVRGVFMVSLSLSTRSSRSAIS
jgi:hypothetical protein